ncbi:hypothetical protein FKR81_13720 [Lentzea tibetensis]|uniref:Uncharacterized protein n=1 Tax=Lentzea tibetensis TaxID=2591470 RepID=A0A563EW06_9PSEU|nr:hypothetical protein [Lentzea tibetensis]TWP51897.1 hypothetical protein FKR81_13720 [Lentzea tibetensis]
MPLKRIGALVTALTLVTVATPSSASTLGRGPWTPTPAPVEKGDITAVAALDGKTAWAVGYRLVSDDEARPIALRWNGKTWAQESELPRDSFPQAIEVRSQSDIWTVGDGVQHWDGKSWSVADFGRDPAGYFLPEGLDSVPSGQAWVVGRLVADSVKDQVPVVYGWDGSAWAKQALPDVGKGELTSVVSLAPNDVWAAGFSATSPQTSLVVHWDGKSWTRVASPSVSGAHTWISALHAGPGGVWAVGGSNAGAADRPFAARWDGRRWQAALTPNIADGRLRAVVSTGDGELWAVGGKGAVTVALRWQKTLNRWVRTAAPDVVVRGVAAVPGSSSLWAVGIAKKGDLVPVITRTR